MLSEMLSLVRLTPAGADRLEAEDSGKAQRLRGSRAAHGGAGCPPPAQSKATQQTERPAPTAGASLADFHGLLVVGAEEVVGAVLLHGLPAVLAHVEHCAEKNSPFTDHADHQKGSPRARIPLSKEGNQAGA